MSGWIQDLVRALRSFRRTPWFVAGLIFVLALGTGANAAIFSLVQAVLLRPLPYDRPDELVMVWSARNRPADWRDHATTESVLAWRESSHEVLSDLAVIKLWDGIREASIDLVLEGAPAGHLRMLVARQGVIPVGFGVAAGLTAAWYGTNLLQRLLFQVEAHEPIVYGVACAVAIVVAILSSILPTRTVGNLPPAVVLRGD